MSNEKNIVIVDNDNNYLSLVKEYLLRHVQGSIVSCFLKAEDFLRVVEDCKPDLIISAYRLPDMTGVELLDLLKTRYDIPVIIFTGSGNERVAVEALKKGAKDYLVKSPFAIEALPDVIHRVLEEHNLKRSLTDAERRFQDIVGRVFSWVWETDSRGIYIYSNLQVKDVLGYMPGEILGRPFYTFFSRKERWALLYMFREIQKKKEPVYSLEHNVVHKDGHTVCVEANAVPVFTDSGKFMGYRGVNRDVSWRKQAMLRLKKSEAQKRAILDASVDRICYLDRDMKIIWANRTILDTCGKSIEQIVGRSCHEVFCGSDFSCRGCPVSRARNTGRAERVRLYDLNFNGMEGETCWNISCVPLKDEKGGNINGFVVVATNITAEVHAEEQIHSLTRQLFRAHESERRMISFELHDRIAQDLSMLKITVDTLIDEPDRDLSEELKTKVSMLSRMLQKVIAEVRDLSYGLRPPDMDQMGLVRTCYHYCEDVAEKTGLDIDFFSAGMDDISLDQDLEINLYRILQEGLNNVVRHANASHVLVRLIASFPKVILRIEDNGRGFDVEKWLKRPIDEKHMGLGSMQERVKLFNGKMEITSVHGKGTKIFIEIPSGPVPTRR